VKKMMLVCQISTAGSQNVKGFKKNNNSYLIYSQKVVFQGPGLS
jgi:hypothetical protein